MGPGDGFLEDFRAEVNRLDPPPAPPGFVTCEHCRGEGRIRGDRRTDYQKMERLVRFALWSSVAAFFFAIVRLAVAVIDLLTR